MPLLQLLARALFVEVMELRAERTRALESRTLWGHVKNLLVGGADDVACCLLWHCRGVRRWVICTGVGTHSLQAASAVLQYILERL